MAAAPGVLLARMSNFSCAYNLRRLPSGFLTYRYCLLSIYHSSANCMVKDVTHTEKHCPQISLAFSEKLSQINISGILKGIILCSAAV